MLSAHGTYVSQNGDSWPVLGEDRSAVGIDFAEGNGTHPSSLEPETESADAAEEIEDTQLDSLCFGNQLCALALGYFLSIDGHVFGRVNAHANLVPFYP